MSLELFVANLLAYPDAAMALAVHIVQGDREWVCRLLCVEGREDLGHGCAATISGISLVEVLVR
jgi:hypothetical protein